MIDRNEHPVGWAQFLYELADAHEHLGDMLKAVQADAQYDESRLRVDMGHVLAHLHRAWYCRNRPDNLTDHEWEAARQAPIDLEPIA
jgi:hypothetical protein